MNICDEMRVQILEFEKLCSNCQLRVAYTIIETSRISNYVYRRFNFWSLSNAIEYSCRYLSEYFFFADYNYGLNYYAVHKNDINGPVFLEVSGSFYICAASFDSFVCDLVSNPENLLIFD
jgi:hypothetical protein